MSAVASALELVQRPATSRVDVRLAREIAVRDSGSLRESEPMRHTTLGEIALAEGRPREALAEFARGDSLPDGPMWDCIACVHALVGGAYDAAGLPISAAAAFERYLATPDYFRLTSARRGRDPAFQAGVHKRLGELYEAKGDAARAAPNCAAFVELWKDAGPELQPKVAEARRRLASIVWGQGGDVR